MTVEVPHIVTDSTADLPPEVARRLDITVIPCQIQMGGRTYLDGVDITRPQLYQHMRRGEALTTSQPPVGIFADTYRRLLADGRPLVAVHLGSSLSGLYSTACLGAQEVDSSRITVVDSGQASMCTGWLAIQAAEAAQQGRTAAEIVREARRQAPQLRLLAVIDDLRYLHRGGRVSWASSLLGNLLAIKPIVLVQEGQVRLLEKVHSWSRGIERVAALAAAAGQFLRLAVLHTDAAESAVALADRMGAFFPRERILIGEAGVTVAAHAGVGAVGVACLLAGAR